MWFLLTFVVLAICLLSLIPLLNVFVSGRVTGTCSIRQRYGVVRPKYVGHALYGLLGAMAVLLSPFASGGWSHVIAILGMVTIVAYPVYNTLRRRHHKELVVSINETSFAANTLDVVLGLVVGFVVSALVSCRLRCTCHSCGADPLTAATGAVALAVLLGVVIRFMVLLGPGVQSVARSCPAYLSGVQG